MWGWKGREGGLVPISLKNGKASITLKGSLRIVNVFSLLVYSFPLIYHTDTHTDTYRHRHTNTRTYVHRHTHTNKDIDTQTHRHTDTQTHRHIDTCK